MATFSDYKPKTGLRQPRIIYRVDDPAMAPLEELRRVGGLGSMNAIYLEALALGAGILLARLESGAVGVAEVPIPSQPSAAPQVLASSAVPAAVLPQSASAASLPRDADARSPGSEPGDSGVVTTLPPLQEPRIGRSPSHSSAAMAQFNRFGTL